jgi:hypothetical protein
MKSALDCLNHASACERMAREADDDRTRRMLLSTANGWRRLAALVRNPNIILERGHLPQPPEADD